MFTLKNNTHGLVLQNSRAKNAFTLIELLVVITIIGILATGAVSVYTSQIQKARDTTRINDIKALQAGVEQIFQDAQKYPDAASFSGGIAPYLPKIPKDPKSGEASATTSFDYAYNQGMDWNGIEGQTYELSTAFEAQGNLNSKAANTSDRGGDDNRLEVGVDMSNLVTSITGKQWGNAAFTCVTRDTADTVACGTSNGPNTNVMLIK